MRLIGSRTNRLSETNEVPQDEQDHDHKSIVVFKTSQSVCNELRRLAVVGLSTRRSKLSII